MAEYNHFIYSLLALLVTLAALSLIDVFNHAALYVLGFSVLVAGAFWWGDRSRRRVFRGRYHLTPKTRGPQHPRSQTG